MNFKVTLYRPKSDEPFFDILVKSMKDAFDIGGWMFSSYIRHYGDEGRPNISIELLNSKTKEKDFFV